jgi:AraC-like DNA-binding protein
MLREERPKTRLACTKFVDYHPLMGTGVNTSFNSAEARRTGPGTAYQVDHSHSQVEFNLIVSGKGTYFHADGHYDLTPGTLVWLLPGQSHRLMRSPDLDMWVVTIDPEHLDAELLHEVAAQPCRILSSEDAIALDRLLSHVCQDTDEPQLYHAGLQYLFRSAWHMTMTSPGPSRRPVHPSVLQALTILRGSSETPTAAVLAKKCGINQDYLGQLLMEHTGRGFVEWRNRTRLERFHVLYPKSGDLLTASLEAGFGSYTQFHRVFVDLLGTTPGEWARNGHRANGVVLPSVSADIKGSNAESARMAWYPLSERAFPAASRWFTAAFAPALIEVFLPEEDGPIIATGLTSLAELRRFEPDLVEDLRTIDPGRADMLERIFNRNDLFEHYRGTIGQYGLGFDDLSVILGQYLAIAFIGANRLPAPNAARLRQISHHLRHALQSAKTFSDTSVEERQKTAAAFVCQTMFLRNALTGARASGSEKIRERIIAASHATALVTTGIDVTETWTIS